MEQSHTKNITQDRMITDAITVTVCICTFRRVTVLDAIKSVAEQKIPLWATMQILVIDNDDTPTAKEMIVDYCANLGIVATYLHVPGRNISIARNAALEAVRTLWLAFLDDDELASPHWLQTLLSMCAGATALFGPCIATYRAGTPHWIMVGDYHSNRFESERRPMITGHTCNVLIDARFVREHGLSFDISLGRTGGEDTMFFYKVYKMGGVLKYVRDAVVHEHVSSSRANFRWIAARRYRAGQVYALMFRNFDGARYWGIASFSPIKIAACVLVSAATALFPHRAMWWIMRAIFHLGILSIPLGARVHAEYASVNKTL